MLKKEVTGTSNGGTVSEDRAGYRQALVKTLHTTSIKFPSVASTVVPLVGHTAHHSHTLLCHSWITLHTTHTLYTQLLEFLSDSDETTADGVLVFVREAVQTYPQLKSHVVAKLLEVFPQIKFLK